MLKQRRPKQPISGLRKTASIKTVERAAHNSGTNRILNRSTMSRESQRSDQIRQRLRAKYSSPTKKGKDKENGPAELKTAQKPKRKSMSRRKKSKARDRSYDSADSADLCEADTEFFSGASGSPRFKMSSVIGASSYKSLASLNRKQECMPHNSRNLAAWLPEKRNSLEE